MDEMEYETCLASLAVMTDQELEAFHSAMGRRHNETAEDTFAELHDAASYALDWREMLRGYGMTEEEYAAYVNQHGPGSEEYAQFLADLALEIKESVAVIRFNVLLDDVGIDL